MRLGYLGGRHSRSTGRCEFYKHIDLAELRRKKLLKPGADLTLTWRYEDNPIGNIGIRIERGGIRLSYESRDHDDTWEVVSEWVPFAYTATNFGGKRRWLVCKLCGRRCRILYGGRYFRCRRCYGLTYQSQYEDETQHADRCAAQIKKRLGGFGDDIFFPEKPKGLHWKTYRRLRAEHDYFEGERSFTYGEWCTQ